MSHFGVPMDLGQRFTRSCIFLGEVLLNKIPPKGKGLQHDWPDSESVEQVKREAPLLPAEALALAWALDSPRGLFIAPT